MACPALVPGDRIPPFMMRLANPLVRWIDAVGVRTLFPWGEDDAFGDEAVARRLVGRMADAELEMLSASGRLPWLDAPDGLAGRVAAYLHRSVDVTARPVGAAG